MTLSFVVVSLCWHSEIRREMLNLSREPPQPQDGSGHHPVAERADLLDVVFGENVGPFTILSPITSVLSTLETMFPRAHLDIHYTVDQPFVQDVIFELSDLGIKVS